MAHTLTFKVTATLERDQGKFMARDEMAEQVQEALEGADPGSIDGGPDGDSSYSVTEWEVSSDDA